MIRESNYSRESNNNGLRIFVRGGRVLIVELAPDGHSLVFKEEIPKRNLFTRRASLQQPR